MHAARFLTVHDRDRTRYTRPHVRRHSAARRRRGWRPEGRRRAPAARLRRAAQARGRPDWPTRSRARRCKPPRWSTRPTSGWSAASSRRTGTAAATSSPRPPRPCAASWSTGPDTSRPTRPGAGAAGSNSTMSSAALVEPDGDDLLALDEALRQLEANDPRKAELVKLRFFAGLTERTGRRRARRLHLHRREGLVVRPQLAPAHHQSHHRRPILRNWKKDYGFEPGFSHCLSCGRLRPRRLR